MSARRLWVWTTVLVATAAAIVVVTASDQTADRSPIPSTFSSGQEGCKALYLVLEELQLPVERLRTDFTRIKDRSGVLVVVQPQRTVMRDREKERLKEWVEKGNRLVLFQGVGRPTDSDTNAKTRVETRSAPRTSYPNDLARMFGLTMRRVGDASRTILSVSFPGANVLGRISVSGAARWKETPEGWLPIAHDAEGPVVLAGKVGSGTVAAVSDATLVSNRYLPLENNLQLVLALLLAEGRPRTILFDEHHHGYTMSESFWGYMGSSVFLWVIVQSLVGFALFFYSRRASYAGTYRTLTAERGRSPLEHVESMAGIFEVCKASSAALAATFERFLSQLSRSTGTRMTRLDDPLFGRAGGGVPAVSPEVAALFDEFRTAIRGPDDPDRALALSRKLAEARASAGGLQEKTSRGHFGLWGRFSIPPAGGIRRVQAGRPAPREHSRLPRRQLSGDPCTRGDRNG